MTHCSHCGALLPHAPPVTCAACGTSHWRNPKPCAAALVTRDGGELLLVKRAHAPWQGHWCAPSGFCEHAEHPIDAAVRETFEETGLAVELTGHLGTWVSSYDEDDVVGEHTEVSIAVTYYHARLLAETPFAFDPAEVAEARWFPADELPADLAPPHALPRILAAWHAAVLAGETVSALRDNSA